MPLAANFDWEFEQFDVRNTFLRDDLNEEIYMDIPPSFRNDVEGSKFF